MQINGAKVGYLCRDDARTYRPGLLALETRHRGRISLAGVVVGGGIRQDGPGMLGVWLSHDPADFDIDAVVPPPVPALAGAMRTGLTEALLTDAEDDSYDLSWLHRLPSDTLPAIRELRRLLEHEPDPIDRHYMYCELEDRLYRSRDAFASALAEYDDTCLRHDAEMNGIRDALLAKFGKVPVLETYRQMAVRQKAKDWQQAIWWAERGLALYGEQAARPESVDDLRKRLTAYQGKIDHTSATGTEGGAQARYRADQPSHRSTRMRGLRRELRSRSGSWSEAEELPGLPLTQLRRPGVSQPSWRGSVRSTGSLDHEDHLFTAGRQHGAPRRWGCDLR